MQGTQLVQEPGVCRLELVRIRIRGLALEIVDTHEYDHYLRMERAKVPALGIGVLLGSTHHRVFIQSLERPFRHDVRIVAHEPAATHRIHLVVGLVTLGQQEGIALGSVRLLERSTVLGAVSIHAVAHRKGVTDKLDAAV